MKSNQFKDKLTQPLFNLSVQEYIDLHKYVYHLSMEDTLEKLRFGVDFKDEVLDRRQVSELLNVSPDKITSMVRRKEIPGSKKGKEYFFLKSEILKSLKKF
jgi:hypothetical protein